MIHDPPSAGDAAYRQAVLDAIKRARSPAETKRRILLAREFGVLSDAETEEWIAMFGVAEA